MTTATAEKQATGTAKVPFPSTQWFERLAEEMRTNRARFEHLGYCDCVAVFTVNDGPDGKPFSVRLTFDEFDVTGIEEAEGYAPDDDFALEADLETWRAMIESIKENGGRPARDQTLNYLSLPGTPIFVRADDALDKDKFFRFNQSLQAFVNGSAAFDTAFE